MKCVCGESDALKGEALCQRCKDILAVRTNLPHKSALALFQNYDQGKDYEDGRYSDLRKAS